MYSTDAKANRENSETPSPMIGLENQLVYKLASLEATISNSLRRLDEKFDRLQTELHDRHIEHASQLSRLESSIESRLTLKRARLDAIEERVRDQQAQINKEIKDKTDQLNKEVRDETDKICSRVETLEKWQTVITTRATLILGGVVSLWAIFGDSIQGILQRTFS